MQLGFQFTIPSRSATSNEHSRRQAYIFVFLSIGPRNIVTEATQILIDLRTHGTLCPRGLKRRLSIKHSIVMPLLRKLYYDYAHPNIGLDCVINHCHRCARILSNIVCPPWKFIAALQTFRRSFLPLVTSGTALLALSKFVDNHSTGALRSTVRLDLWPPDLPVHLICDLHAR
ncbi:hypothetical protein EDD15DRAFT_1481889 [Pisolithus albus]|nr:hypothetical protein EDD15DRAFT_1481889 [Pisolithus albus]